MNLSIIIPVYNGENFIDKNFHNVLNQNLEDFEIIYVDNNSKDGSFEKLLQLEKEHVFVRVYQEQKQGSGAARNKGIEVANGKYICFLDVDDLYYDGVLNKYLEILELDSSISSVYGKHSRNTFYNQNQPMNKIHIKEPPFQGVEWFTHFSKLTGPPSFMHRIDVVKELGGFPESLLLGQDAAFHINLALNYKIAFLDSYAYCYTRHSNSTTVKNNNVESFATKYFKQYVNFYIPEIIVNNEMLHLKTLLYRKVFNAMSHIIMEELSIAKRWSKCKRLKKKK